jgi:hypothetical protein
VYYETQETEGPRKGLGKERAEQRRAIDVSHVFIATLS